jgi:IclR family pca regulon transcriptional regulator
MSDERLSLGIRSIAAPVRDGDGRVRAAVNVTVHAAETSVETLTSKYLPVLLKTAEAVSAEWANLSMLPVAEPPARRR